MWRGRGAHVTRRIELICVVLVSMATCGLCKVIEEVVR